MRVWRYCTDPGLKSGFSAFHVSFEAVRRGLPVGWSFPVDWLVLVALVATLLPARLPARPLAVPLVAAVVFAFVSVTHIAVKQFTQQFTQVNIGVVP